MISQIKYLVIHSLIRTLTDTRRHRSSALYVYATRRFHAVSHRLANTTSLCDTARSLSTLRACVSGRPHASRAPGSAIRPSHQLSSVWSSSRARRSCLRLLLLHRCRSRSPLTPVTQSEHSQTGRHSPTAVAVVRPLLLLHSLSTVKQVATVQQLSQSFAPHSCYIV